MSKTSSHPLLLLAEAEKTKRHLPESTCKIDSAFFRFFFAGNTTSEQVSNGISLRHLRGFAGVAEVATNARMQVVRVNSLCCQLHLLLRGCEWAGGWLRAGGCPVAPRSAPHPRHGQPPGFTPASAFREAQAPGVPAFPEARALQFSKSVHVQLLLLQTPPQNHDPGTFTTREKVKGQ